jgi:hypothetical protein
MRVSNDRTSRSCPVFESDNMAKQHHNAPSSGLASSAAPPEAIRMRVCSPVAGPPDREGLDPIRARAPYGALLISCRDDGHAPRC